MPFGRSGAVYSPISLVVTVRLNPVPLFVIVTVAWGTTAPVGSLTTPLIAPVIVCAQSGVAIRTSAKAIMNIKLLHRCIYRLRYSTVAAIMNRNVTKLSYKLVQLSNNVDEHRLGR